MRTPTSAHLKVGEDLHARIEVALDVKDRKQLERILAGIKRIPGVFDIERVYNV